MEMVEQAMEKSEKRGGCDMKIYYQINDICVCCGEPVPEGYMVCPGCQRAAEQGKGISRRTDTSSAKHVRTYEFKGETEGKTA